jgi:hypothetical protein
MGDAHIKVEMGRCRQAAHCYVQLLPSGPDDNSNGYAMCWRKEYPMENGLLAIFFMQSKRN